MSPRLRTRAAGLLLAGLLAAAVVDGLHLQRLLAWNQAIQAAQVSPAQASDAPELQFALAAADAASATAHAGPSTTDASLPQEDAALKRYRALQTEDTALGRSARFNSANLLLRQALRLRASPQPGQAIPLIELAKEHYRDVLRQDPQHWPARYNLERAQRLLPDPEPGDDGAAGAPERAERAATTVRAHSMGMP